MNVGSDTLHFTQKEEGTVGVICKMKGNNVKHTITRLERHPISHSNAFVDIIIVTEPLSALVIQRNIFCNGA